MSSYGPLIHESPSDCVFVHGAGGNNLLWRRTLHHLTGRGRAFAINLPGHPDGTVSCHSVKEYAEAVHAFIAESGLRRPSVCGHSMGGAVCLRLALDHPGDLSGLALVDTGAKLGVLPEIIKGLEERPLKEVEKTITPMSFYELDLDLAREGRSALSLSNPAVFLNDYLACSQFDGREWVSQVSARTLLVCGENDRLTPPKWTHYLHDRIASSSAFFIREAGHMVPLEKPSLLAALLQRFLSSFSQ